MRVLSLILYSFIIISIVSCAGSYSTYNPNKKFSAQKLKEDFVLLKNILEEKHPSLYWYTSRDSMNYFFDSLQNEIADSMTELQFGWTIIAPLTEKIHCGHTTMELSKNWIKYTKSKSIPSFPLYIKIWGDTMLVTGNLNKKDSVIKRGYRITAINHVSVKELTKKMFSYMPVDGYSQTYNYIRLSTNFPYYHRNIFGIYKNYRIAYVDSFGNNKTALLPMWVPDSIELNRSKNELSKNQSVKTKKLPNKYRSITIDSSIRTGIITLNTFAGGIKKQLRPFIKKSFRKLRKENIPNCIIDLRANGGGSIGISSLLTKYISNKNFKVADTAYATSNELCPFSKYIQHDFLTNMMLLFSTKKKEGGLYHFGFYERHFFKIKKRNHYNGKVYVIIGGPTFSASTLFCNTIKGQENVIIAGEEAGGGWHGNNGILIPDIKLPNTKIKVRLPLFRLVQFQHTPKTGSGLMPDIYISPTTESVKKMEDRKMMLVKKMIQERNQ